MIQRLSPRGGTLSYSSTILRISEAPIQALLWRQMNRRLPPAFARSHHSRFLFLAVALKHGSQCSPKLSILQAFSVPELWLLLTGDYAQNPALGSMRVMAIYRQP